MTLKLLAETLCEFAIKQNLVNSAFFGPNVAQLNPLNIEQYPVMYISPTETTNVKKNTTEYRLTFYYIDRLLEGDVNEVDIFSVSIDTLTNFLRQIKEIGGVVDVGYPTIRNFTMSERGQDRCAGGYTTVSIEVLNNSNCPIYF